jgi:hypothetical protein
VANKSDCTGGSVEGFSSSEINDLVALWTTYILICCFSRRASGSFLESLQVSPYCGSSFQYIYVTIL